MEDYVFEKNKLKHLLGSTYDVLKKYNCYIAGQRKDKKTDIPFSEFENITNGIVIEAMALYLSGDLKKIKEEM